jgi:acyl-CoA synthetase (AMP-forming)/AMP-acid ligase II
LRETFAANPAVSVFNIYGLTEAGRACYRRITAEQAYSRSIGRPSRGVTIEAPGTAAAPGEIVIRGPNLMAGYLRAIQDDELQLDVREEIRTGDLGYYDERGELVLVGRKDHMINVTGNKIHPSEIESLALQVPGVLEAQAWAQSVPPDGASVHLRVVPGSPAPFTIAEYFPDPTVSGFHDPRQHAVALAFVVPVDGDCRPSQSALDLTWLSPEEAVSPGVAAEMSGGRDRLVRMALAFAGSLP